MVRLSMQAVIARRYGPPEDHEIAEIPAPEPGPGQIQVRIAAVSINPADVRLAAGDFREAVDLPFPHVPGNDFAGTVSALGEGVHRFAIGDEIFGFATPRALRHMGSSSLSTGALAQYAVFEADTPFLAHRPEALDIGQAAALPTVGLTARALMATAEIKPGARVLVVGATGGVGTTLLPLLAAAGAHVTATARPADADLVRSLGATEAIDYDDYPPTPRPVDPAPEPGVGGPVDLVPEPGAVGLFDLVPEPGAAGLFDLVPEPGVAGLFDLAFNLVVPGDRLERVAAAVRPGGRLLTITFPPPPPHDGIDVQLVLDMEGRFGGMAEVAADAVAGRLRARIAAEYEFADAVQALSDFAGRHKTGKLVVRVRSRS
jgi:NADPH:quinone reductase-like Zn-dependent oxidoreductase